MSIEYHGNLHLLTLSTIKMKGNAYELENALLTIIKKQAEVVIASDDLTGFRKLDADERKIVDCENRAKKLMLFKVKPKFSFAFCAVSNFFIF